jgi:hypothetical protein
MAVPLFKKEKQPQDTRITRDFVSLRAIRAFRGCFKKLPKAI